MKAIFQIARVAFLELLFERSFRILAVFFVASFFLSLCLGQLTYGEKLKLTLDFMLVAIHVSLLLFSVFMSISLFQRESRMGSIFFLLSKPIPRAYFYLGKFFGQITVQGLLVFFMGLITWFSAQRFEVPFDSAALAQSIFLLFLQTTLVTAVTYFFASFCNATTSVLGALAVYVGSYLRETLFINLEKTRELAVWKSVSFVLPALDVFDTKSNVPYGLLLSTEPFLWTVAYAIASLIFLLGVGTLVFRYRDIQT